jgi:aryl-alcohol dehydrogenase-like predicted oxidoreductase
MGAGAAGLMVQGPRSGQAAEIMRTRPIPSSGEALPVIGMGTSRTFDVGTTESERTPLREVLDLLLARGGRVIDSSPM